MNQQQLTPSAVGKDEFVRVLSFIGQRISALDAEQEAWKAIKKMTSWVIASEVESFSVEALEEKLTSILSFSESSDTPIDLIETLRAQEPDIRKAFQVLKDTRPTAGDSVAPLKLWDVTLHNGEKFDLYVETSYFVAARTQEEAKSIASERHEDETYQILNVIEISEVDGYDVVLVKRQES